MKKPYEKPAIVYAGEIEARAVFCLKAGEECRQGPITS